MRSFFRWFISLFRKEPDRVHNADPRDDLPCKWCKEVTHTTVNEIWCKADPTGYLVRICDECRSSCAGG
jgi:hypothetical protein